ncbi:hypothetical protein [Nonomuraea wenchangensis]|uniref:Uncharacterized protein n=1 Tax=Nonomuraea wenchangensis TaxID=568860 RepID=A0A1I0LU24_9ACTN|nr:hypothetical protein [Nonomuraea wenchangensis]SEU46659.1 hypothetical protein SAMN05421811_127110 [Nonomuraea wenchangensis]
MTDYQPDYINQGGFVVPYEAIKKVVANTLATLGSIYQPCIITAGQVYNPVGRGWKLLVLLVLVIIVTSTGVELTIAIPSGR